MAYNQMSNELIAGEIEKLRNQWFRRGSDGARLLSQAARRLRSDGAFFRIHEADVATREQVQELDDLHDFED